MTEEKQKELSDFVSSLHILDERILIEPIEAEEKTTASGLIVHTERPVGATQLGKVLAVGQKVEAPAFIPGTTLLFARFKRESLKIAGKELIFLTEEDILAVVEN